MVLLYQRFPLYARPLQFLGFAALFAFGLYYGLNWSWDWSLQTGNVFILISVPSTIIELGDDHAFFMALALVGLIGLGLFGTAGRSKVQDLVRGGDFTLWSPRFRFYPLTLLLGLFLTYFGTVFLFKASVTADDVSQGFVAFVYLNYAGIVTRGLVSLFAAGLLCLGVSLATIFAFQPGLGMRAPAPPDHTREPAPESVAPVAVPPDPQAFVPEPEPVRPAASPRPIAPARTLAPTPRRAASTKPATTTQVVRQSPTRTAAPTRVRAAPRRTRVVSDD